MPGHEGEVERSEVEARLETRRELGPTYDAALVDSFAERIETLVEARYAHETAERREGRSGDAAHLTLGLVSVGAGIPITAIAASITDLPGLIVAWAGIVGVNAAYALRGRRGR